MIELVKNSFDADARSATVTLEPDALTIEDDGTGMTRDELVAGFLRLASTFKVKEPKSRIFKRQRAGRKGIGRFATQRLGSVLRLKTWVNVNDPGIELVVDWRKFESGRNLDEVPVYLGQEPPAAPGTKIRIELLRDEWSDAQIRRCWRGLLALQQPFPVAPVEQRPGADPGFEVRFLREGGLFNDPKVVADFQSEILDHRHATIEFRVNDLGIAEWRLTQNKFGPDRGWQNIHHEHRDGVSPPAYRFLRNVAMKAHYFIIAPDLLPSLVFTRVRDILREEGGIRLYRNGFRVVPYGESGNDWLHLDQLYAQRGPVLAPVANRNFFGVIEVHDPEGVQFEEHTSREGLIETDAFGEVTGLAMAVLATAVNRIAEDRGRKRSAGGSAERKTSDALDRLRKAAQRVQAAEEVLARRRDPEDESSAKDSNLNESQAGQTEDTGPAQGERTAELLHESIALLEQQQAELADEAALLRLLATLGLTTSEFSHETGMTFEAVRMDFRAVFEAALQARADDDVFAERAERANAMLSRLDALTAYLNELASARSVRQLSSISVSKAIDEFAIGVRSLAEKAGITMEIDTPEYDPLYTKPMHSAEVASILLNFFSNSLKALRRTEGQRRIEVKAERENDGQIVIRFSDTGDGIPEENREKVFDLFFTSRVAAPAAANTAEQYSGTGLGLWIVHQIISKAGGDIEVIDPPAGFATCLEVRLPAEEEK
ncbi:sensor histidine kinase [Rhodobacter maris]|uniref:sensor histidine kinase n=1 Tax=Rhodobacter maris TaxID=446682 RepID=UPI001596C117|nr:sensor histidine kinase [Rhodobacter maris]